MAILNLDLSPKENILALFNEILATHQTNPVTLEAIHIAAPTVRNTTLVSNTSVVISNDPDQNPPKLKQDVEMIYNRLSLPEIYRRATEGLSNPQTETIFSISEDNWDDYTDDVFKQEILDLLKLHPDAVEIVIASDSTHKQAEVRPKEDNANWIYVGEIEIDLVKE